MAMAAACILTTATNVDESLLQQAFQKQLSRWNKRKECLSSQQLDTKYGQRRECAGQIQAMCRYFEAMPAVFASCVGIMDSALIRVNISWKYLSCFSAACFIIGSKWVEDEYQPSITVLADLHYKQWKEVDLRRMEEKVLQVLGWEIPRCTYVNFLPHMTRVLAARCPTLHPPPPVSRVIQNAEMVLLKEFSFVLKPAAVALGAVEHAARQCGAFTPELSLAVIALQDSVKVLDSELHEIGQVLSEEDNLQQEVYKSNKAYFPKVFETPCDSFLPDHRLYNIPEEYGDAESDLRTASHLSSPCVSISDYDYSDEEDEQPTSSTIETETVDSCRVTPDCTVLRESIVKQSVGEESDADQKSTDEVSELDPNLECASECELFSRTVLDPALLQEATEPSSTSEHIGLFLPVTSPTSSSEEQFTHEDSHSDSDSGCEQESDDDDDEQDSRTMHGPCEQVFRCEQDSECDQDSDFHDSSPCRICHVKACVNEVQASQALTFN